jgi:hypothetical protein
VLFAQGVTKTYRSGVWPRRRTTAMLRGADVALHPSPAGSAASISCSSCPSSTSASLRTPCSTPHPPPGAGSFPAHGAIRVLLDGAFTTTFDQIGALLLALAWLAAITAASFAVFHRLASPRTR